MRKTYNEFSFVRMAEPTVLLTLEDIAKRKGVSRVRLWQLTQEGRIPGPDVRSGRYAFYTAAHAAVIVHMYIEDRRKTRWNKKAAPKASTKRPADA